MIDLVKTLRDMTQYNFFITSLIKEGNNDNMIISVAQKSLGELLPAYFDFCFSLVTSKNDDGTIKRALTTDTTVYDFCKSRSNNIELYEQVNLTNIIEKVMA